MRYINRRFTYLLTYLLSTSAGVWLERLVSKTTYNVVMGTLNPTHSLTHSATQLVLVKWRERHIRKWTVNAPHCVELAWKLPLSTCRYLVLTVCDRKRLNSATFVPDAIHTVTVHNNTIIWMRVAHTGKDTPIFDTTIGARSSSYKQDAHLCWATGKERASGL